MQKQPLPYLKYLKNPNLIAVLLVILTTGFLRSQLMLSPPASDSGYYAFACQWFFNSITQGVTIKDSQLYLYQFMTAWVYGLDINQIVLLKIIDCFVAIVASIVLFNVILKESGSKLFTVIFMASLLIILHDFIYVLFGYRNSIWAAYLPLFSALLVWQNASKEDKYSFYLIGGLVSFGILLREPFLPFFLIGGLVIHIGYGWRALFKYLIGSTMLVFSVLGFVLMFRGWDLYNLIHIYILHVDFVGDFGKWGLSFTTGIFGLIQTSWYVCIISVASILYLIKLNFSNKRIVVMHRFYFWILVTITPLIEPIFKIGYEYHYANCLIGLAGISAMGWKYLSNQESKPIERSALMAIGLMSLLVTITTVNNKVIKPQLVSLPNIITAVDNYDSFRQAFLIERNQYLTIADKVYSLSREDSTLAVSGLMQVLYPLTELNPPNFELSWLRYLYIKLNFDEDKLIKVIEKQRPTIILTTDWNPGDAEMSAIIDKIDLYEKIEVVPVDHKKSYGWKSATIYRLKDF